MRGFFYGQTEYSILENALHLEDYISFSKAQGYHYLTITDSNLYGHYKFFNACLKNGIKPIIGLKIYIESKVGRINSILAYAKNKVGYQNLLKLSTLLMQKPIQTPYLEDEEIQKYSNGLFFVSTALDSDLEFYIYEQHYDMAKDEVARLSLFGEFYVGIMPSTMIFDTIFEDEMILVDKLKLKVLPLEKTCYFKKEDRNVYETLLKIKDEKRINFDDDFHLRSLLELENDFASFPECFDYADELVEKIETDFFSDSNPLPTFVNPYQISSKDYLTNLCQKGLEKRLNYQAIPKKYQERLDYELSVICKMNYEDYFLIVWDLIKYAKTHDIMAGPGRGSAVGSLVAYTLGITEIDPIEYNLLFERFLNPERISMPDIDMDFPDNKRDDMILYAKEKYGKDHVCYITAFGTFQLKSSIRDLFRVNNLDERHIAPITSLLEQKYEAISKKDFEKAKEVEEKILKDYEDREEYLELISVIEKMVDLPRNISTHASGIIISSKSLYDIVPLRDGIGGIYQSQLEAVDLEKLGLLKMDFLGISNLAILDEAVKEINKTENLDIRKIPLDDPKTYKLFQQGDTLGIFQLESTGIINTMKSSVKVETFLDLVALISLYRPGPMKSIPTYVENKKSGKIEYLHKDLEPVLKDTYGVLVYQEQIMQIAQVLAGYTLGGADVLRHAVAKKKKLELEAEKEHFFNACKSRGYEENIIEKIYEDISRFAEYGFNKSHALGYAILAYRMAYIKANYPSIFLAKLLNNFTSNKSELKKYVSYTLAKGLKVLAPNINISTNRFEVVGNDLVLPLNSIQGIGSVVTDKILAERSNKPFESLVDFNKRMNGAVNKAMLESLIHAGAFDSFGQTHAYYLSNIDSEFATAIEDDEAIYKEEELSIDTLRENELQALGFNLTYDLFRDFDSYKETYKASMKEDFVLNKKANVIGLISRVKEITTKKGEKMAFVTLNSNYQMIDIVVFAEVYQEYAVLLKSKKLVLMNGIIQSRNNELQLQLIRMKELA